jgi:hypothetical protein
MAEYYLSYTASEIDEKLNKIDSAVMSVNGNPPDKNGNVMVDVTEDVNDALAQAKQDGDFKGDPGEKGDPGLVWKGDYQSDKNYSYGDVVAFGGSSYVAIEDINSHDPHDDPDIDPSWNLLVAKGANGKNGTNGKTPVKGTDYFTASDKAEMVSAVIAALPVYAGEVL